MKIRSTEYQYFQIKSLKLWKNPNEGFSSSEKFQMKSLNFREPPNRGFFPVLGRLQNEDFLRLPKAPNEDFENCGALEGRWGGGMFFFTPPPASRSYVLHFFQYVCSFPFRSRDLQESLEISGNHLKKNKPKEYPQQQRLREKVTKCLSQSCFKN